MSESQKYLVRDPAGNVYGPATAEMLAQWVRDGRIVAGMGVAPRETREWIDAAEHPATAEPIRRRLVELLGGADAGAVDTGTTPVTPAPVTHVPVTTALVAGVPMENAPGRPEPYKEIPYGRPPRTNAMGVISFICGTLGVCTSCMFCFPPIVCASSLLTLTAITLGVVGIWQVHQNPPEFRGKGLAVMGVSLGVASGVIYLIEAAAIINLLRS